MKEPGKRLLFGLKVRQLRQTKQLSYADLAGLTGLSVSFLNEIEKGKKFPRPERLRALARGLQCSPAWLSSEDPGPHLAPVAALLQSDFLSELPLDLFGIDTNRLLELLAEAPSRVHAFLSSLVELAQDHALGEDHFFLTAMRAYQELHNNYFPELEQAALSCRNEFGLTREALNTSQLKRILINHYGVRLIPDGLAQWPELLHLRSVNVPSRRELLLHPQLEEEQLLFQLAKEIGFQFLHLQPRPFASTIQGATSFAQVLHNFKAGYFAVALLIPEKAFLDRLCASMESGLFHPALMASWLNTYGIGPDILFQRFNVITAHWGLDQVFFHRLIYHTGDHTFHMDKELHLHRVKRRYARRPGEHYCRRWLSVRLINRLAMQNENGPATGMGFMAFEDHEPWLCLGMARASAFHKGEYHGWMIGLRWNAEAKQKFRLPESSLQASESVGLTCERCPLTDCSERASPPVVLEQLNKKRRIRETLKKLTG